MSRGRVKLSQNLDGFYENDVKIRLTKARKSNDLARDTSPNMAFTGRHFHQIMAIVFWAKATIYGATYTG